VRSSPGRAGGRDQRLAYGRLNDKALWERELERVTADGRRVRDRWVLVDCADWTNVRERAPFQPIQIWNEDTIGEIMSVIR
jgi:hypothetical protein